MSAALNALRAARRVVVKIGSAQLVDAQTHQEIPARFADLAQDFADLRHQGVEIVLVTSGAIAVGRSRLKLGPGELVTLEHKQAAAAAGQAKLIQLWDQAFETHGLHAAQALLSPADTEHRGRWLNARNTVETLLKHGLVPVINENDTVATEEIRFGDNDRLAARVAQLVGADMVLILSDVDGLYDRHPDEDGAQHLDVIDAITPHIKAMAGPTTANGIGTGGMASKIAAAEMAMAAGCTVIIARGDRGRPLQALESGARASVFRAAQTAQSARTAWITGSQAKGNLHIDTGAKQAVLSGKSLLPAGVTKVEGRFQRGETVRLVDPDGQAFALGLAAYDDLEARAIAGLRSSEIEPRLGYRRGAGLVHAEDLIVDGAVPAR